MESLCEALSLSRSPEEARRRPRREDSPFMSQFPPEEMVGTSGDELPDRDPACRKEDFQLGRVCSLFPGPRGAFLESVATAAPSRDEVLSEGGRGPPGSAWLSSGTTSEPQPTVQGGPPWGATGPSGALPLKSWLCLRIRTVIRCWTRDVPSMMVTGSSICGRSILGPKTVARFWTLILLTLEWD